MRWSRAGARDGALLAAFSVAEQARFREAAAYNLDRKQPSSASSIAISPCGLERPSKTTLQLR